MNHRTAESHAAAMWQAHEEAVVELHHAQDAQAQFEESSSFDYLMSEDGIREADKIGETVEQLHRQAAQLYESATLRQSSITSTH